jgi:hypothetical protein
MIESRFNDGSPVHIPELSQVLRLVDRRKSRKTQLPEHLNRGQNA